MISKVSKPSMFSRLKKRVNSFLLKTKDFLIKFKLPILISLVGGVPGLINIWNWSHNSPGFVFHSETISYGVISTQPGNKGVKKLFYLLSGAIYNPGNQPLFPYQFEIEATYDDTVIRVKAQPIDSGRTDMKGIYDQDLLRSVKKLPLDASYVNTRDVSV